MNWLDLTLLIIITLSALISLMRGFIQEAISLGSWILAFWVALSYSENLDGMLASWIDSPTGRIAVAFVALFAVTLLVGGILNYLVGGLIQKSGLSGTDRLLGMVFGAARGVLLVAVLVLMAGLTTLPQESWWKESSLVVHFEEIAHSLQEFLPDDVAKKFRFP
ncbi:MAG TPA: CvpA family protein [Thiotrichales bacterium]|nr:CvpA family protein [Thiotrichales bacterium]